MERSQPQHRHIAGQGPTSNHTHHHPDQPHIHYVDPTIVWSEPEYIPPLESA